MASLPTGSDKLIAIRTEQLELTIKSKKKQTALLVNEEEQSSSVLVAGYGIESVRIENQNIELTEITGKTYTSKNIKVNPMFFEQSDYEIVVRSRNGQSVSVWHESPLIRERISPVIDDNNSLVTGIINFGNEVGYSDFEISADGRRILTLRIEIYPSKISYKDDYTKMMQEINEMAYAAEIDFLKRTHREFAVGDNHKTVPAIFFELIRQIFDKYIQAVNRIISVPHHKLITEHYIVPAHKAKKTDRIAEKWLDHHQDYVSFEKGNLRVERVLSVSKRITYDTNENRFVKFVLKSTIGQLDDFLKRYKKTLAQGVESDTVITEAHAMKHKIHAYLNGSFLADVSEYTAIQSMSLVFGMAPGYRELYKFFLLLHRGLSFNGAVFRISMKDTAQLYEYWCFIKLFSILKNNYSLHSRDIIQTDETGVTITLKKGKKSEITFVNPRTGEQILLTYNPGEEKTQTINQRPDNVLSLEKKGSSTEYKYVFDAKYRVESEPDSYYPDTKPGPKADDINTMHRYRDSIVYENAGSKFMFEKKMFGAYILFPYNDEEEYKNHRFYKSIQTVNIGGLPFLPGSTELVSSFLDELIADSPDSAFERASLPVGIEEKLARVDWNRKDVIVGSVRDMKQFEHCISKKYYYTQESNVPEDMLPIRYVALCPKKNSNEPGIVYYGEIIRSARVKRTEIPFRPHKLDERYYTFVVREWKRLPAPIRFDDDYMYKPGYTNSFLLQNSESLHELFNITTEEQYRILYEIKRAFDGSVAEGSTDEPVIKINDEFSVVMQRGFFDLCDSQGKILLQDEIKRFKTKPRATFTKIIETIEKSS